MADYSKYYEAREVVTRILEQDFIGPVTKDECLAEVPVQYYIMGKLYPQRILWRHWIWRGIPCWKMRLKPMMYPFL